MLKGESLIERLILCVLLFVAYFRKTKLSICISPQEGSIEQCLEVDVHEVEVNDEFDVTGCFSGVAVRGYMGQDGTQTKCVVAVKTTISICFHHCYHKPSLKCVLHTKLIDLHELT